MRGQRSNNYGMQSMSTPPPRKGKVQTIGRLSLLHVSMMAVHSSLNSTDSTVQLVPCQLQRATEGTSGTKSTV